MGRKGRPKKYQTEEEKKAAQREANRRWRKKHPEYMKQHYQKYKEQKKQYQQEHKEEYTERSKQYYQTPKGRAHGLLQAYKQKDKKHNRGECTLTVQWIMENIFTQKCAHCEKTGWDVIGCNRIDNSLPHTPENVEPCCFECNMKLSGRPKKN